MTGRHAASAEAGPARDRFRAACLALASLLLLNACASMEPIRNPAESPRPNPPVLIVAPARFEPAVKLDPILRTKGKAAAEGVGLGALGGVAGTAQAMVLSGPLAVLLLPVFVPIGAVYGAVAETSVAASDEAIAAGRLALQKAIGQLQLQQRMKKSVIAELRAEAVGESVSVDENAGPASPDDRPGYPRVDAPMVLELSVLDAGFSRRPTATRKDGYALVLTTQARLLDTRSQAVLDLMKHAHRSEARTATEWLQDNAASFERAVDEAIQSNARDIVLEFFRLYYPPSPAEPQVDAHRLVPLHVLNPIHPEPRRGGLDLREIVSRKYIKGWAGFDVVPVNGLQPTFRWEALPRPIDLPGSEGDPRHFSDVTYEMSVFRAVVKRTDSVRTYVAGPLVYARNGLTEPWHRIEAPLQACVRYAWTVRARFKLDGQPRVTEWTVSTGAPWKQRRSVEPPEQDASEFYLLFRAPPADGSTQCTDRESPR